jgi:signal transduction histidine kinase
MGARVASPSDSDQTGRVTEKGSRVALADALWLATMQRIASLAAHEVKGALNGVSLNLEVVRSRSEKQTGELSSVRPFASAAADQFEAVIGMTEALLSLARPAAEPVDVGLVVRRLGALLAPAARADEKRLDLEGSFEGLGVTSAGGSAVRLALGGGLLAALEASAEVRCTAPPGEILGVRIDATPGSTVAIDDDIIAAVTAAGIRVTAEPSAIFISFPR